VKTQATQEKIKNKVKVAPAGKSVCQDKHCFGPFHIYMYSFLAFIVHWELFSLLNVQNKTKGQERSGMEEKRSQHLLNVCYLPGLSMYIYLVITTNLKLGASGSHL
jgi:hypothetical protein